MNVMKWLLEADPAIRWQVMRDLTKERKSIVAAERARVATEGWGALVLKNSHPVVIGALAKTRTPDHRPHAHAPERSRSGSASTTSPQRH